MSLLKYFTVFIVIFAYVHCDDANNTIDLTSNETNTYSTTTEAYETTTQELKRVDVYVYYETLCPYSINFFYDYLEPLVLSMHKYIKLHLYPYGNAKTEEKDGKFVTSCQHGEPECYGNKLHACAIDILKNETKSALYSFCMLYKLSDDDAANECGNSMKINANPIKECAKSDKGNQLLKYYSDLGYPEHYRGVPAVVVDRTTIPRNQIKKIVCEALSNPPPTCTPKEEDSS